ncbi:phage antirepressor KilAC domain-containing protein [Vitreoscilla massiliensis]|uniref:Phage antirepressor KilAC domain-containing protein n=1 Tax=Vitreoscilla massiliensis TaxID=1689272 RepID=A0ABY4E1A9_9NEIS|nr:phage antirepressor KilAC domain-containing protein [Vitreoscilla massiliensis]UOO89536.1 phage antirepressor KilAC domain-containing protein [Vitreoscilla massiliensis]
MNELFSLVNSTLNGEAIQTVSARELHEFLEVKSRFNDWIGNRIEEFEFIENQDFVTFTKNLVKGRPSTEYHISLDMAKELSMVERNEKGKQARLYFIECERKAKSAPMLPQSFSEALRLAADLQDQLALAAPKAAALDRISQADGDLCLTDAAKTLGMQPRRLTDWLSQHKWIYKRDGKGSWIGYQDKIQTGYLHHSEYRYFSKSQQVELLSTQVLVTPKGLARIARAIEEMAA